MKYVAWATPAAAAMAAGSAGEVDERAGRFVQD
jgi:hypothetical protein